SARSAIREVFLSHVIGGKGLSRGSRFTQLVRCATPEAVLTAVELLADVPWRGSEPHGSEPRQVAAVDVGGATTDVYSVLTPDPERAGPRAPAAGTLWRSRTVEGDLGTRQSAPGVVQAAASEGLLRPGEQARLRAAAAAAAAPVAVGRPVPASPADQRLAELAMVVALRRHARGERVGGPDTPRLGGKDLRGVDLLIGSGGALRHSTSGVRALAAAARDHAGGWPLPERAVHTIDIRYVLAAAGLLAGDHRGAASRLLTDAFLVPK
ncbi:MAG: glutamate mutase L, partial [Micromonosporaceae bacterium]